MPVAILRDQIEAAPSVIKRRIWTRRDCEVLEKAGVFEGRRYELINGELIDKMAMNPPHAVVLHLLVRWLNRVFGDAFIRAQMPIDVSPEDNPSSQPQPDACVTSRPVRTFMNAHPGPGDILLLVEVSDSTLAFDTTTKAELYARAGIADYWVLDVNNRRTYVHRLPRDGEYQSLTVYEADEPVSPVAAPDAQLLWSDLGY